MRGFLCRASSITAGSRRLRFSVVFFVAILCPFFRAGLPENREMIAGVFLRCLCAPPDFFFFVCAFGGLLRFLVAGAWRAFERLRLSAAFCPGVPKYLICLALRCFFAFATFLTPFFKPAGF